MPPLALILSSYVAASRIGGGAQQFVLAACRIDPVLIPTVLFGASPAKGGRGRAVDPELFGQLLAGVEGLLDQVDLVITGHFSLPEQVEMALETVTRVRAARLGASAPRPVVVVDPILGDEPKGLYVKADVAAAVVSRLVPAADWITPNLWELSHMAGRPIADAAAAAQAVRDLGCQALVTSVPAGEGEIGLLCCDGQSATLFAHPRLAEAPKGTGDLVTAVFGAGLAEGLAPVAAAERAARAVREALEAAQLSQAAELPLVALGERLARPAAQVRIEHLP